MSLSVRIQDAVKRYGNFCAVNHISLSIEGGEFFTLLGPSGCGKTTLLRMIAGFNEIDGGKIFFGDRCINDIPPHRRNTGMVTPRAGCRCGRAEGAYSGSACPYAN